MHYLYPVGALHCNAPTKQGCIDRIWGNSPFVWPFKAVQALERPLPLNNLIGVFPLGVGVGQALNNLILHFFLDVGRRRTELGHPVNHVDHQVKTIDFVVDR